MGNQVGNFLNQCKELWNKQEKNRKILIGSILGGILLVSIIAAILLNSRTGGFVVLYNGLEASEGTQIYQMLKDMSVEAQIDSSGQILVRKEDKDMLLIELSALGYPKSAPSYDIFTSNAGLTTTEFEKRQYLLFQLQDRIEKTIMNIEGVKNAIVTLVMPEESTYVWQDQSKTESTASVLITLKPGATLSSSRISAIKNLVSSSVPNMQPSNVTIVNAITSLEMRADDEYGDSQFSSQRMDFETQMEQKLIEKAFNILSIGYDPSQMRVSATVVIDYSKMITEEMQYIPEEDGNGVPSHIDESYQMGTDQLAGGIAGEENNTDIPIYVDNNDDGIPETIYHVRNIDYFVSYVKQQIEKDNTQLVSASLAVSLNDGTLTESKRANLVRLLSNATNIPETNISVVDLMVEPTEEDPEQPIKEEPSSEDDVISLLRPYLPYLLIGVVLLLLLIGLVLFLVLKKRKGKRPITAKPRQKTEAEELEEALAQSMIEEAEAQRKKLRDAALASVSRDNAVSDEVKEFANDNPEITASLIRAWLKEVE